MPFTVKVCGITRPSDAADALAQGVAFVGVNRWPQSPRYVPEEALPALWQVIPAGKRVFVDVETELEKLTGAVAAGFDFFQIHFDPARSGARDAVAAWEKCVGGRHLWLAPRVAPGVAWPLWVLDHADTVLCDGFHAGQFGGTGRPADWTQFAALKNAHPEKRWLLAGGLGPANLAQAASSGADFFDLNSGVEDAPGVKNPKKLAEALAVLRKINQA